MKKLNLLEKIQARKLFGLCTAQAKFIQSEAVVQQRSHPDPTKIAGKVKMISNQVERQTASRSKRDLDRFEKRIDDMMTRMERQREDKG